jgi:drug/metabolite transporter (DMT)-like permease
VKGWTVHIVAVISMFFWGLSYIWSKYVFEVYSPLTTIFFRLTISFVVLFVFVYATSNDFFIYKKDYPLFALSALFNPFLYFIGENFGLKLVSASVSAIIVATIPLFAPFIAWYYYKEKLKLLNTAGLVLSFIGLLFIILKKDFSLNADPVGLMLLSLAVVSALFYMVVLKKLTKKYPPVTIIMWQNLIGAIYFLPFFLFFDFQKVIEIKPDIDAVLSLLMLGIFSSSLAYVLYTYTLKHLGIIKSSLYTNLIPVFTALLSFYLLSESFTFAKIIGMIIVISGLILSEYGNIKENGKDTIITK